MKGSFMDLKLWHFKGFSDVLGISDFNSIPRDFKGVSGVPWRLEIHENFRQFQGISETF